MTYSDGLRQRSEAHAEAGDDLVPIGVDVEIVGVEVDPYMWLIDENVNRSVHRRG